MNTSSKRVFDKDREELIPRGPAPDPVTGRPGASSGYNFAASAIAHPRIRYKGGADGDRVIESDLHLDESGKPYLLILCPRCEKSLTIRPGNKAFLHRPHIDPEIDGELSVEEFACTHDLASGARCGFRGAIDKNILRRT